MLHLQYIQTYRVDRGTHNLTIQFAPRLVKKTLGLVKKISLRKPVLCSCLEGYVGFSSSSSFSVDSKIYILNNVLRWLWVYSKYIRCVIYSRNRVKIGFLSVTVTGFWDQFPLSGSTFTKLLIVIFSHCCYSHWFLVNCRHLAGRFLNVNVLFSSHSCNSHTPVWNTWPIQDVCKTAPANTSACLSLTSHCNL